MKNMHIDNIKLTSLKRNIKTIKEKKQNYLKDAFVINSRRGKYVNFEPFSVFISNEEFKEEFVGISERVKEIIHAEFILIIHGEVNDLAKEELYKDDEELLNIYKNADSKPLIGKIGSKNNVMYIQGGCISLIQRIDCKDNNFVLIAYLRSTDLLIAGYTDAMLLCKIGNYIEYKLDYKLKFAGVSVIYSLPHFYVKDGISRRE